MLAANGRQTPKEHSLRMFVIAMMGEDNEHALDKSLHCIALSSWIRASA